MTSPGTLFLLPNLLGPHETHQAFLPESVDRAVEQLDGLIAESERAGRRFLSRFSTKKPARDIPIAVLDDTTIKRSIDFYLEPIQKGENWGIVSDAGLPCVADPGAKIVARAHRLNLPLEAFVGPSSIFLALMLSGMGGQRFQFHGYVAKDPVNRQKEVRDMEKRAQRERSTQIFIEAPYRNQQTLQSLLESLDPSTHLCVAWNLTLPDQGVLSRRVQHWPKGEQLPDLHKVPAIFLLSK